MDTVQNPNGATRMYLENLRITFAELAGGDLLTTPELQRWFDCTARTIYRWVADERLKPHALLGRDYLFRKDELMKWYRRSWK